MALDWKIVLVLVVGVPVGIGAGFGLYQLISHGSSIDTTWDKNGGSVKISRALEAYTKAKGELKNGKESKQTEAINLTSGEAKAVVETFIKNKQEAPHTILWVTDNPGEFKNFINAFRSVGYQVVVKLSTAAAIEHLKTIANGTEVIISDIERNGDKEAGYTLLSSIRHELGIDIPFYFCAKAAGTPAAVKRAEAAGAQGSTDDLKTLFTRVSDTVSVLSSEENKFAIPNNEAPAQNASIFMKLPIYTEKAKMMQKL